MAGNKSTSLKVLEGDKSKSRHKSEPQGERKCVTNPPSHLSARAKRLWRRHIKDLNAAWIYTTLDFDLLADLCSAEDEILTLRELRKKQGPEVPVFDREGEQVGSKINPLIRTISDLENRLRLMRQEFGMTPKARMALSVEPSDDDQGIEQYFTK